jgi:hypothetical protein
MWHLFVDLLDSLDQGMNADSPMGRRFLLHCNINGAMRHFKGHVA